MATILELIAEKKQEAERIQAVIAQLEAAASTEQGGGPVRKQRPILEMAELVLATEKKPLRPKDIHLRIQEQFGFFAKVTTINTMLSRCTKEQRNCKFVRAKGPDALYGLKAWA